MVGFSFVNDCFEKGKWFKSYKVHSKSKSKTKPSKHSYGSERRIEQISHYHKLVKFNGKLLPGAAKSAFGQLYELKDARSKNPYKYVLKVIKIHRKHHLQMFEDEIYAGSSMSASGWGTKIYAYTIYNPRMKMTHSISNAKTKNTDVQYGMYIMEHVMKGKSDTKKFTTLDKFMRRFKHDNSAMFQLTVKLRNTLKQFYKVPKIHGDLHHQNILVVYKLEGSSTVKIDRVTIIDYGATHYFKPSLKKHFSKSNNLLTIFKKQRNVLTKNPSKFKNTRSIWPPGSKIKLYRKELGGQEIRLNKQLLNYYHPNLMNAVYNYNKDPKLMTKLMSSSVSFKTMYKQKTPDYLRFNVNPPNRKKSVKRTVKKSVKRTVKKTVKKPVKKTVKKPVKKTVKKPVKKPVKK